VPFGASWVEATIHTSGFDTTRRFFLDAVQVHNVMRTYIRLSSPALTILKCPDLSLTKA
jgi:hypothetical protein